MKQFLYIILGSIIFINGCAYSFKGISIDYSKVQTFSLGEFPNNALNVVPTLSQDFITKMRDKIINDTRLDNVTANGDIQFNGEITGFDITAVAPVEGETTQFNRLTIRINVEYSNIADEKQNFKQSFSWREDYSSTENLTDVQDDLIDVILDQIAEDIFNKAFTNW